MNGHGDHHHHQSSKSGCCCFHPEEVVVGVCACCLKERLLILAAKQSRLRPLRKEDKFGSLRVVKRKALVAFPKVFALGSFLHLFEPHPRGNKDRNYPYDDDDGIDDDDDDDNDDDSVATLEDSFISIKFEDGEQASWNNKRGSGRRDERAFSNSTAINGVKEIATKKEVRTLMVENSSNSSRVLMRWRKHILKLLQFGDWKKKPNNKESSSCHLEGKDNKTKGVKGRRRKGRGNWVRSLINYKERRTTASKID